MHMRLLGGRHKERYYNLGRLTLVVSFIKIRVGIWEQHIWIEALSIPSGDRFKDLRPPSTLWYPAHDLFCCHATH